MRIYYVFFAIAIIVSILMITYTVSKVMCKNKKNKKTTNQTFENEYSIDWRVYVTDVGGNCLSGADIILKNESDSFIIGRSENCIIKLRDPKIGKEHAKIMRQGIVYTYYDLGSSIGSVYNQERIVNERIKHMMVIWIGVYALLFSNRKLSSDEIENAINNNLLLKLKSLD